MTITKGYGIISIPIWNTVRWKIPRLRAEKPGTRFHQSGIVDRLCQCRFGRTGELFIEPGTEVYEGMIVGVANREEDLGSISPRKSNKQYGSSTKDTTIVLKRPRK